MSKQITEKTITAENGVVVKVVRVRTTGIADNCTGALVETAIYLNGKKTGNRLSRPMSGDKMPAGAAGFVGRQLVSQATFNAVEAALAAVETDADRADKAAIAASEVAEKAYWADRAKVERAMNMGA